MKMPTLVAIAATALALPATAHAEPTPPCSNGQVQVSNGGEHSPIEVHPVNSTP